MTIFCDSDFAGCALTRKSTSGGAALWGGQLIKAWSKTQPILALSTGEAELASVVRVAAEALGLRSLLSDFGVIVKLRIESDATAAIGMVKRQGLGKVRHLSTADLWIQQRVAAGDIVCSKVPGVDNPSDMMTKGVGAEDLRKHLARLQVHARQGRAISAPQMKSGKL